MYTPKRFGYLLFVLLAVPIVFAGLAVGTQQWLPTGDLAVIDFRSRDVFSMHQPLTGLVSRNGWNHPGPAMFWLLAPFAWFTKSLPNAIRVGWAVIQCGVVLSIGALAVRTNQMLVAVMAITMSCSYLALPASVFRSPWNPWMPIPFIMLLIVLSVRAAQSHTRDLIGMVIAGSIAVQIHAGTAPVVLGLFGIGVLFSAIDARGSTGYAGLGRTLLWCAAAFALIWALPLVGVLTRESGNLRELVRYFRLPPEPPLGVGRAAKTMAAEFAWRPPLLGGPYRLAPPLNTAGTSSVAWLLIPIGALAVGWLLARRNGRRDDGRIVIIAGVMLVTGIYAISRVDIAYAYTFEWRAVVAAFVMAAAALPIARTVLWNAPAATRPWLRMGLASFVCVCVVMVIPRVTEGDGYESIQLKASQALRGAIDGSHTLRGRRIMVSIDPAGGVVTAGLGATIMDMVDSRGGSVRVPSIDARRQLGWGLNLAGAVGSWRASRRAAVDEVWTLVASDGALANAMREPGARILWRGQRADPESSLLRGKLEWALAVAHRPDLIPSLNLMVVDTRLMSVPGIDPQKVALLVASNREGNFADPCRCAIVVTPGGRAAR